jgi:hypothetical protein
MGSQNSQNLPRSAPRPRRFALRLWLARVAVEAATSPVLYPDLGKWSLLRRRHRT